MSKKLVGLFGLLAIVALVGAGCAKQEATEQTKNTNPPLTVAVKDDALTLTVEKADAGTVNLKWQAGKDLDVKGGFRLWYSGRNIPNDGAYWYWLNSDTRTADWGNIPTGKKFFRVCVWQDDKCGAYSNEVELEVE